MRDPSDSDPRDRKRYYSHPTATRHVIMTLIRMLVPLIMRVRTEGVDRFPKSGACVLVANHVTNFDVFPMQLVVPRPIYFMGKAELFRNPFMDALVRRLGAFPVERGRKDSWALQYAERILQKGLVLGMFPEGSRSRGRGLRPAKTGAARLALQAACPIIPVGVEGTDRVFADFPRRTHVTVRVGEPIIPTPEVGPVELTDHLMYAIAALLSPRFRGVYAEPPPRRWEPKP